MLSAGAAVRLAILKARKPMRCNAAAVCLTALLTATADTAVNTQESPAAKPARKGDRLVLRGCINGPLLEGIETTKADDPVLPPGLTFRLSGDKKLLKQIRSEENGRKVEITGILKSDLPQDGGVEGRVGKTRITVGVGTPDAMHQQTPPHRPVLEAKSFEPLGMSCGR
jgi:hypothetical protein